MDEEPDWSTYCNQQKLQLQLLRHPNPPQIETRSLVPASNNRMGGSTIILENGRGGVKAGWLAGWMDGMRKKKKKKTQQPEKAYSRPQKPLHRRGQRRCGRQMLLLRGKGSGKGTTG
jgi:hypothetical protein